MFSSSIACCRRSISVLSISGCSIKERRSLAPMAVFVLSRTQRREPLFCFSRRVSTSSRFRLVEVSIIMNCPVVYGVIFVRWDRSFFCVS